MRSERIDTIQGRNSRLHVNTIMLKCGHTVHFFLCGPRARGRGSDLPSMLFESGRALRGIKRVGTTQNIILFKMVKHTYVIDEYMHEQPTRKINPTQKPTTNDHLSIPSCAPAKPSGKHQGSDAVAHLTF
jgi:hypothetical protein